MTLAELIKILQDIEKKTGGDIQVLQSSDSEMNTVGEVFSVDVLDFSDVEYEYAGRNEKELKDKQIVMLSPVM
jgi:hypothetical protein